MEYACGFVVFLGREFLLQNVIYTLIYFSITSLAVLQFREGPSPATVTFIVVLYQRWLILQPVWFPIIWVANKDVFTYLNSKWSSDARHLVNSTQSAILWLTLRLEFRSGRLFEQPSQLGVVPCLVSCDCNSVRFMGNIKRASRFHVSQRYIRCVIVSLQIMPYDSGQKGSVLYMIYRTCFFQYFILLCFFVVFVPIDFCPGSVRASWLVLE